MSNQDDIEQALEKAQNTISELRTIYENYVDEYKSYDHANKDQAELYLGADVSFLKLLGENIENYQSTVGKFQDTMSELRNQEKILEGQKQFESEDIEDTQEIISEFETELRANLDKLNFDPKLLENLQKDHYFEARKMMKSQPPAQWMQQEAPKKENDGPSIEPDEPRPR